MRLRAIVILIIVIAVLYFKSRQPMEKVQVVAVTEDKIDNTIPVERINSVAVTVPERAYSNPGPQKFLTSYSPEEQSHGLDIHPDWEHELYGILQQLDPENAERIFRMYKEEKLKHLEEINLNLFVEVNNLSLLNGESIAEELIEERNKQSSNLNMLEVSHQKRIKLILGEHLEYIQTQYDHHKENNQY